MNKGKLSESQIKEISTQIFTSISNKIRSLLQDMRKPIDHMTVATIR